MDSVREFNVNIKREVSVKEIAAVIAHESFEAVKTFFEFLLYIAEYAISAVYRAVKSEKAAYIIGKYKRVVLGVSAGFVLFAAIGIIGGMEAGLISLGVGAPVAAGLILAFRLLGKR
ncbi:MAG: hypothetical protein IJT49_03670 [Clostridia bacterium]|nr:hypothetical protein [Clostridia bacterium]